MIGEDAANATLEMTNKLLTILLEIIKLMREQRGTAKGGTVKEKQPKIKFGEMKCSDYKKLLKSGEKVRTVSFPANKLDDIKNYSQLLGAQYWVMESDRNTVTAVVPEKYMNQFDDVLNIALKEQLSKNPSSLSVKDGSRIIPEKDIDIVRQVLDHHDIPAYSLKNSDGNYVNIVPSEYEGQYEQALREVSALKEKMDNIDIEVFDQTMAFDDINGLRDNIIKVSQEQADYLKSELKDDTISFVKDENGITAVRFPDEKKTAVVNALEKMTEDIRQTEDYLITVVDSHITINKEKLLISENETEYFTRVPNTGGQDYIRISKSEAELSDGGKTITTKLDYSKTYNIYDNEGNLKSERPGRELGAMYNTKSRNANKDTEISHYHNDSLERVELYNDKENKLISIGIVSAEAMRRDLEEQGITGYAADKLISDINKAMPSEYAGIFEYTPPADKAEFSEIKSDIVKQYEIAAKIEGCEMTAGTLDTLGKKCLVFDKNTDKYVMTNANENTLREGLVTLGYDDMLSRAVVSEIQRSYDKGGAVLERESVQLQSFDTLNAEAMQFNYSTDSNCVTVIKTDISGDDTAFKYLEINKEASRSEIETAMKKNFDIKDTATVAAMMSCLDKDGLIPPVASVTTKDGFEVSRVTSDHISVSRNGESLIVNKDNINAKQLCDKFGVTPKQAEAFIKSVDRSLKAADRKTGSGKSLREMTAAAMKAAEKIKAKSMEKTAPAVNAERGR